MYGISVLGEFVTGFAMSGRVVITLLHRALSSPNLFVSLIPAILDVDIWGEPLCQ